MSKVGDVGAKNRLEQMPVDFLFSYESELSAEIFDTGFGDTRMFTQVTSGTFEGPKLRGEIVVGPSAERAVIRPDGALIGDVNLLLRTHDKADILMRYTALAIPTERGFNVRNFPLFETADERYTWLNTVQALTLYTVIDGIVSPCDVYQLL